MPGWCPKFESTHVFAQILSRILQEHTSLGIRSVLKEVNWARAGLGMPLLPSTLPKPQHLFSSPSPTPPISSNFDTGMVYNSTN